MKTQLLVETWRGLTPLGLVAVIGLGGFGVARTALMVGCHITQPYIACADERSDWQKQMGLVAGGFWLLYTRAPGTSDAPASASVQALPPWRRPDDEPEPVIQSGPRPVDPVETEEALRRAFVDAIAAGEVSAVGDIQPPPSAVINPDAPADPAPAPGLTTAERMDRAARRLQGGGR